MLMLFKNLNTFVLFYLKTNCRFISNFLDFEAQNVLVLPLLRFNLVVKFLSGKKCCDIRLFRKQLFLK